MVELSPDYSSLTSKQKKVYNVIESFIKLKGIPPTVREIGELVGEKTPGAVQGILNRLEQKGVIKRELGMARSIKLVLEDSSYVNPVYVPELKKVSMRNVNDLLNIYNIKKQHPISQDLIEPHENLFTIECPFEGLAECFIFQNDLLIVSMDTEYNNGDIVLAIYENNLLIRKYSTTEPGMLNLNASSSIIDKQIFNKDEVVLVGKIIGKFTRF
ncbi:MAG TPA: S24 family peptidase [Clostridia bacterium]|nr:S24 family peptidase [Clostridia bacterium]